MNARRMLRVERRLNRKLWKALSKKLKRLKRLRRELSRLDAVEEVKALYDFGREDKGNGKEI